MLSNWYRPVCVLLFTIGIAQASTPDTEAVKQLLIQRVNLIPACSLYPEPRCKGPALSVQEEAKAKRDKEEMVNSAERLRIEASPIQGLYFADLGRWGGVFLNRTADYSAYGAPIKPLDDLARHALEPEAGFQPETLKHAIAQFYPDQPAVSRVVPTPFPGWYQIHFADRKVLYSDWKGDHLFNFYNIFNLHSGRDWIGVF